MRPRISWCRIDAADTVAVCDAAGAGIAAAGGADFVALLDVGVVAEDDGADGLFFKVEGDAHAAVGEFQQLGVHRAGKPVDAGNAVAGFGHGTDVGSDDGGAESLDLLAQDRGDLLSAYCHSYPSSCGVGGMRGG